MDFPQARQQFYNQIRQPEERIDLAMAALYIAKEEYPNLDEREYINALDTMAAEVEERLSSDRYPLRLVRTINHYLYDDLGFVGNSDDYYNPRNSFLNDVIDRRTGIPITLSLVYLEIARRIDFPMVGIGMPGHFLIRPEFEDVGIFIDTFNRGEILFPEDCEERLTQIYGRTIPLLPKFVEPIGPQRFLARMLTNLKMIYLNRQDGWKALAAIERILLLFPEAPLELRDRGLLYFQLGHPTAASQDLETYLARVPGAEDAEVIRQLLERMRLEY